MDVLTPIDKLANAVARREGYGAAGKPNIPTRLNNPGDLMFAHQTGAVPHPVVGVDGKTRVYAAFATPAAGFYALKAQIRLDASRGETLAQFVNRYAPASDGNDPASYLAYVMKAMGVSDSSVTLASVIGEP